MKNNKMKLSGVPFFFFSNLVLVLVLVLKSKALYTREGSTLYRGPGASPSSIKFEKLKPNKWKIFKLMQRENNSTFVSTSMPIRCKKKNWILFLLKQGVLFPVDTRIPTWLRHCPLHVVYLKERKINTRV